MSHVPAAALSTLLTAYLNDLRIKNWSEMTLDRRRNSLNRFIQWANLRSITNIKELTPDIIEAYQRSLYHIGNLRNRKPLQFATQASYLSALIHWLRWSCKKKYIASNPASEIELPKEERHLPASVFSIDEVERVLNQADVNTKIGMRDRAIMEVIYSTAIRRTELIRLTVHDIDRGRRLVAIRQGKGKKDRIVPIGVRALEWLDKYLADVRPWLEAGHGRQHAIGKSKPRLAPEIPYSEIFLSNTGHPFEPTALTALIREHIESAGITKKGSCHIFRHSAATLMLENGADLRSLQTLLGHESLNSTQIYTHVTITRLREVHDATHPAQPDVKPDKSTEVKPNRKPDAKPKTKPE